LTCSRLSILKTTDNLARGNILHSNELACVANCGDTETTQHHFLSCAIFDNVWQHVRSWIGIDFVAPNMLQQHFAQFSYMAGMPRSSHIFFLAIWFACV
jgi:hypothetical protein